MHTVFCPVTAKILRAMGVPILDVKHFPKGAPVEDAEGRRAVGAVNTDHKTLQRARAAAGQVAAGKVEIDYLLYDARACGGGDTDRATVLCVGRSEEECIDDSSMFGQCAVVKASSVKIAGTTYIFDEEWVCDCMDGVRL